MPQVMFAFLAYIRETTEHRSFNPALMSELSPDATKRARFRDETNEIGREEAQQRVYLV